MTPIQQQVLRVLQSLSSNDQRQVLDFVEFLRSKRSTSKPEKWAKDQVKVSFLKAAGQFIGCADGPADLSSNPDYMAGYGI